MKKTKRYQVGQYVYCYDRHYNKLDYGKIKHVYPEENIIAYVCELTNQYNQATYDTIIQDESDPALDTIKLAFINMHVVCSCCTLSA